jgi:hypothetical protein
MLWALDIRIFLFVRINDISPDVAFNERMGLLCAEKWERLLENVIVCIPRYPGELKKTKVLCML